MSCADYSRAQAKFATRLAAEAGTNLQSWLLCVEMLPAAVFMLFAFPWSEYVVAGGSISGGNITHAISIRCARPRVTVGQHACRLTVADSSAAGTWSRTRCTSLPRRITTTCCTRMARASRRRRPRLFARAPLWQVCQRGCRVAARGRSGPTTDHTLAAVGQESSQHQQGANLLMNMELGGMSTWPAKSSGDEPPAPGQIEGAEAGTGVGRAATGSEDQQLAGPSFSRSDDLAEPPRIGKSRYLAQEDEEEEHAVASGSGGEMGASKKGAGWDDVSLGSPS